MILAVAVAIALQQPDASAFIDAQMGPMKTALLSWLQCRASAETRFRDLDEHADVLADAVLGACVKYEDQMRIAYFGLHHRDGSPMYRELDVDRAMQEQRATGRNQVIADLLDYRAKKNVP